MDVFLSTLCTTRDVKIKKECNHVSFSGVPDEKKSSMLCNIPILSTHIIVDYQWFCESLNLYTAMLLVLGSTSTTLALVSLSLKICYGAHHALPKTNSIPLNAAWAATSTLLSRGFEKPSELYYLCITIAAAHTAMIISLLHYTLVTHTPLLGPPRKKTGAEESLICSICLDTAEGHLTQIRCKHIFHHACLLQWRQNTCPLCRAGIGAMSQYTPGSLP